MMAARKALLDATSKTNTTYREYMENQRETEALRIQARTTMPEETK
jgi:hypothetical protein